MQLMKLSEDVVVWNPLNWDTQCSLFLLILVFTRPVQTVQYARSRAASLGRTGVHTRAWCRVTRGSVRRVDRWSACVATVSWSCSTSSASSGQTPQTARKHDCAPAPVVVRKRWATFRNRFFVKIVFCHWQYFRPLSPIFFFLSASHFPLLALFLMCTDMAYLGVRGIVFWSTPWILVFTNINNNVPSYFVIKTVTAKSSQRVFLFPRGHSSSPWGVLCVRMEFVLCYSCHAAISARPYVTRVRVRRRRSARSGSSCAVRVAGRSASSSVTTSGPATPRSSATIPASCTRTDRRR